MIENSIGHGQLGENVHLEQLDHSKLFTYEYDSQTVTLFVKFAPLVAQRQFDMKITTMWNESYFMTSLHIKIGLFFVWLEILFETHI